MCALSYYALDSYSVNFLVRLCSNLQSYGNSIAGHSESVTSKAKFGMYFLKHIKSMDYTRQGMHTRGEDSADFSAHESRTLPHLRREDL